MTGFNKTVSQAEAMSYQEESPRLAIIAAIVVLIIVTVPLGLLNKKISDEGSQAADVSLYTGLADKVGGNVRVVREMLEKGVVDMVALAAVAAPRVTLITPEINPSNMQEAVKQDPNKIDLDLSAIYWNPKDPLVTIDDENYRVDDKVKGFTILEIRETEVVLRSPLGEQVVIYIYDYL